MKKVALINPAFSKIVYGNENSVKGVIPALGLYYLQAYNSDIGNIKIFEGEFYPTTDDLIVAVNEYKPEIIGITTNTTTFPECVKIAKQVDAKTKVAGGPYSSFRINESLNFFDIVFIGDAEISFRKFLLNYKLSNIPGIAYKNRANVIITNNFFELEDLDNIPFPNHNELQMNEYRASPHREFQSPFATMITTRGCGFQCKFCLSSQTGLNNGKYRERSIKNVIEEVNILVNKHNVKSIQFWDDTFTMNKKRTLELCKGLEKYKIEFICNTRTDKLDDVTIKALSKAGCKSIFFGVESGDIEILKKDVNKGIKIANAKKIIELCSNAGISTMGSYMFGFINDTKTTIKNTLDFALFLKTDYVLFNIVTPHPGTTIYKEANYYKIIIDYKVEIEKYKKEPVGIPTICTNLSRHQLHLLKTEAYLKYYSDFNEKKYEKFISTYTNELIQLEKEHGTISI